MIKKRPHPQPRTPSLNRLLNSEHSSHVEGYDYDYEYWSLLACDAVQHGVSCEVSEEPAASISGEQLHPHYQKAAD